MDAIDSQKALKPFNNVGQILINPSQLPLSCPLPDETLWNAHPRVYLPILEAGEVTCPYCSAHYILQGEPTDSSSNEL